MDTVSGKYFRNNAGKKIRLIPTIVSNCDLNFFVRVFIYQIITQPLGGAAHGVFIYTI